MLPFTRYVDCQVCDGSDEADTLLHCRRCRFLSHPQCLTVPLSDDYAFLVRHANPPASSPGMVSRIGSGRPS